MIKTFANRHTQELYETGKSKRFPSEIWKRALRRLEFVDLATRLEDLKIPPSNRRIDRDDEAPGISVFYNNQQGDIFHTYSCYARGLDMLNGAYHYMDLVPKGRDEDALPYSMAWLRRHDQYDG